MKKIGLLLTCLVPLLLVVAFWIGRVTSPKEVPLKQTDTICVVKLDTILCEKPVYRYSYIHDTVRTYFTTIEHDTVLVDVPIERKVYAEDSLYRAVVSGWRPSLDSLTIYPKETIIEITNTVKIPPKKWTIGATLGPSVLATPKGQVHAGLGVTAGLTYNF